MHLKAFKQFSMLILSLLSVWVYWTTCEYTNSRISNLQTSQLADWMYCGLDNLWTNGLVRSWTCELTDAAASSSCRKLLCVLWTQFWK